MSDTLTLIKLQALNSPLAITHTDNHDGEDTLYYHPGTAGTGLRHLQPAGPGHLPQVWAARGHPHSLVSGW